MASESSFATFTSGMEPIDDISHYPPYLQTPAGRKVNDPLKRGRRIFDNGKTSSPADSCTMCLRKGIPCVRYRAKYGKCAFCTMKDLHPEGLCHLEGVEEPVEGLSKTSRMKKRKLNSEFDADSNASNDNDSRQGRFTAPTSAPRSVRGQAPSPDPSHLRPDTQVPGPAVQSGRDETLARVTALEGQVQRLEGRFQDLLDRLNELNSALCSPVSAVHAQGQGIAGEETRANQRGNKMSICQTRVRPTEMEAVPALVIGEDGQKHSMIHAEGCAPEDCICLLPFMRNGVDGVSRELESTRMDANMADANGNGFY